MNSKYLNYSIKFIKFFVKTNLFDKKDGTVVNSGAIL